MTPTTEHRDEGRGAFTDLKGCPFCGAKPHQGLGKIQHCSLHGEPFQDFHIKCPKGHASVDGVNRERAVEAWNTRAIDKDCLTVDDLAAATQLHLSGLITPEKYNHIREMIRARSVIQGEGAACAI